MTKNKKQMKQWNETTQTEITETRDDLAVQGTHYDDRMRDNDAFIGIDDVEYSDRSHMSIHQRLADLEDNVTDNMSLTNIEQRLTALEERIAALESGGPR